MSRKPSILGRIKSKFSWRGGSACSADAVEQRLAEERERKRRKSKSRGGSWLGRRKKEEGSGDEDEATDDGPIFDLDDPLPVLIETEQAHELSVAFDLYSKVG